jgi:hypothetical protein
MRHRHIQAKLAQFTLDDTLRIRLRGREMSKPSMGVKREELWRGKKTRK